MFLPFQKIKENHEKAQRENLTLENCLKGCSKVLKMTIFDKKLLVNCKLVALEGLKYCRNDDLDD